MDGGRMRTVFRKAAAYCRALSGWERLLLVDMGAFFLPYFIGAFTAGLTALAMLALPDKRRRVAAVPRLPFLLIWAGLAAAAGLIHRNFTGTACLLVFVLLIVFALVMWTEMTPVLADGILTLTAVMGIAAFAVAAVQWAASPDTRPVSTFYNANYYGTMCELIALMDFFALLRRRPPRALFAVSLAADVGGIALSGCRSAWFAVFTGMLVILACLRKPRAFWTGLVLTLMCVAAVWLFPALIPRAASFPRTETVRFRIWATAWRLFCRHPVFGEGFLGYSFLTRGLAEVHKAHAHNLLLDALVNYGAVGTVLALLFLVPAVAAWSRRAKNSPLCALVLGALAATIVHGITDVTVVGYQTGGFVMAVLALSSADRPDVVTVRRRNCAASRFFQSCIRRYRRP